MPRLASGTEALSGEPITVNLRNDCDRAIDVVLATDGHGHPPPDAAQIHLAAGERRAMQVDAALWFRRKQEDGSVGGGVQTDIEGAEIRFSGADCASVSADAPSPAR